MDMSIETDPNVLKLFKWSVTSMLVTDVVDNNNMGIIDW